MPTNNAWNSNIPVEISKGGTNATSMATSTGIVKYDGTSLVTSSTALIDSSNRMTNTSQPVVFAYKQTDSTNATGDGTLVTIVFDTEITDQNNNYNNSTGTFTAPVAGTYFVHANVGIGNKGTSTAAEVNIVSTARTFYCSTWPWSATGTNNYLVLSNTALVPMAANDTVTIKINSLGGTKNNTLLGLSASRPVTYLCIYLVA